MELGRVQEIPCEQVRPFTGQPRKYFNKQKMDELTTSIKEVGQRVPAIVKVLPKGGEYSYELVDGERRFRACKALGRPLKAWVREITDIKEQFLESVVANFGREEHGELEIMEAIVRVRNDHELTLESTAAVFGRSIGWVQQYLSLRKLEPQVLQMMSPELPDGQRLTFSHAVLLTSLKPELQIQIASTVIKQGLKIKEVRHLVERHIGQSTRADGFSPRKEHESFKNFLQRTMIDLELLLKRPKDYFANMFEFRVPADLEKMSGMVDSAIDNLTTIKETLDRVKGAHSKRKTG